MHELPKEILGVRIPDSDLARGASLVMAEAAPAALYNHCLRTYVLGALHYGAQRATWDEEAAFVASILHDIGLLEAYAPDPYRSFEENGASFAQKLVEEGGFTPDRADLVYKGILLHAGRAGGERPDVQLVMIGAKRDVFGPTPEELSDESLAALEQAVPRAAFKDWFPYIVHGHLCRSKKPTWTAKIVHPDDSRYGALRDNRWSG